MAPVYDFRHVELDKIGRGKRIVKPPGGECSDIFGVTQNGGSPRQEQFTPLKSKNYMQSNIFSPDAVDSPHSNGHSPTTPSKMLDTQQRLFGASPNDDMTPRKIVNRQRSSIFEDEVTDSRPKNNGTPARRVFVNPITGEPISENGTPNGSPNGTPNGLVNGTSNGTNGYTNGHSSPESPMNGNSSFRVRNPPGGKSSGIF